MKNIIDYLSFIVSSVFPLAPASLISGECQFAVLPFNTPNAYLLVTAPLPFLPSL